MRTNLSGLRLVIISLSLFFLFVSGCGQSETEGVSERKIKRVSAHQKEFQNAMKQMEQMKAEIQKHHRNYEMSVNNRRNIVDDREAQIALSVILTKSKKLYAFAGECLRNDQVIRHVSNAANTYNDYQQFAQKMIERFN